VGAAAAAVAVAVVPRHVFSHQFDIRCLFLTVRLSLSAAIVRPVPAFVALPSFLYVPRLRLRYVSTVTRCNGVASAKMRPRRKQIQVATCGRVSSEGRDLQLRSHNGLFNGLFTMCRWRSRPWETSTNSLRVCGVPCLRRQQRCCSCAARGGSLTLQGRKIDFDDEEETNR
jgi:hypothetical protein